MARNSTSVRTQRWHLRHIVEDSGRTDDLSKPWAIRTTIHYLRRLLDSGPEALSEVREKLGDLPNIRARGDQLYTLIQGRDLQNHFQRLIILTTIRDTLGLRGKVTIIEPGEPDIRH